MTIAEPLSAHTEPDGHRMTTVSRDVDVRETKPSPLTTEFWAMLVGIVAFIVIYNASSDRSLNLFRASLLITILAVGYMISRGLAKSGTRDTERHDRRDR